MWKHPAEIYEYSSYGRSDLTSVERPYRTAHNNRASHPYALYEYAPPDDSSEERTYHTLYTHTSESAYFDDRQSDSSSQQGFSCCSRASRSTSDPHESCEESLTWCTKNQGAALFNFLERCADPIRMSTTDPLARYHGYPAVSNSSGLHLSYYSQWHPPHGSRRTRHLPS